MAARDIYSLSRIGHSCQNQCTMCIVSNRFLMAIKQTTFSINCYTLQFQSVYIFFTVSDHIIHIFVKVLPHSIQNVYHTCNKTISGIFMNIFLSAFSWLQVFSKTAVTKKKTYFVLTNCFTSLLVQYKRWSFTMYVYNTGFYTNLVLFTQLQAIYDCCDIYFILLFKVKTFYD